MDSSYLAEKDSAGMVFSKPLPLRRNAFKMAGFLVLLLLILGTLATLSLIKDLFSFCFMCFIGISLAAFCFFLAGPDDIHLNREQRTYDHTMGWSWKPITHSGPIEDIKGVCITPKIGVMLLWRKPNWRSQGVVIGGPNSSSAAQALAEDVSREFGFPIVPYPK